jgi:metallo-beta-lactamase family protein
MTTIEFLGGVGTVTGSKFLVEIDGQKLLVDCGLFQGLKEFRLRNWDQLPVEPASIEWVILTHAHIDHIGYLPRLFKDGFRGDVYATPATADLAKVMLADSGHLQEEEAEYHNKRGTSKHAPALPLYTEEEGLKAAARISAVSYRKALALTPESRIWFERAGHILGSGSVAVSIGRSPKQVRLVFSGDVGRYDAPILPDPALIGEADYIVVESTYGDRLHNPEPIPDQLERVINDAVKRGGAIVVPAFAVGRTQELIYHLDALEKAKRIPRLPTYVDSPMAIEATEIYCAHPEEFDGEMQSLVTSRRCPLSSGEFRLVRSVEESKALNAIRGPVLIISASGMATGGRVLHHLKARLPDPRTTVLLVGYQAIQTRGRLLQDGAKSVKIFGEEIPVRARVEAIHGLSAHADSDGLMRWLKTAARRPKTVFIVHGEPDPAKVLAGRIRSELGWDAVVPQYLDRARLD